MLLATAGRENFRGCQKIDLKSNDAFSELLRECQAGRQPFWGEKMQLLSIKVSAKLISKNNFWFRVLGRQKSFFEIKLNQKTQSNKTPCVG